MYCHLEFGTETYCKNISVINSNPFNRSLFRRKSPFVYMCKSHQSARRSLMQDGVYLGPNIHYYYWVRVSTQFAERSLVQNTVIQESQSPASAQTDHICNK